VWRLFALTAAGQFRVVCEQKVLVFGWHAIEPLRVFASTAHLGTLQDAVQLGDRHLYGQLAIGVGALEEHLIKFSCIEWEHL
jgi:hypothetical protein